MSSRSPELQMLDLFRVHFFGSRQASRVSHAEISPNQAFILSELVRRDAPGLEELHQVLKMHVSSLSRAIAHLNKAGMAASGRDPHDSRRVRTVPTVKGIAFARASWASQQAVIAERLKRFQQDERKALESFLRAFIGEDACKRIAIVPNEPEMAILSRAMTYDHGVVTDNYLESGYSVLDWIILSEIFYEKRGAGELAKMTRTPPSTLSIRLKVLQQRGLLLVSTGLTDRRSRDFRLSAKGERELQSIESCASRYFARTLAPMPDEQRIKGIELFGRYVNELMAMEGGALLIDRVSRTALDSLRRTLFPVITEFGKSYPLGFVLLKPENQVMTVAQDSSLLATVECEKQTSGSFKVINLVPHQRSQRLPPGEQLQGALEKYLQARVRIPQEFLALIDSMSMEAPRASE